jgi:gamma-glutamyl hercynylcysteine S-oxide hydrolase
MCRHLAYLGPPATLRSVVIEPPHALYRQAWAPRRQRHGTVNADGFGVGWYADGDPAPARYRRAVPIWADPSLADLARVTRTRALLACVRDATEGCAPDESAAAPFAAGQWLFSHNGAVPGWPRSVAALAAGLPAAELLDLECRSDSALVWALVLHRLRAGADPAGAVAEVVTAVADTAGGRLNLLLTDGTTVVASAWGDTLWYRHQPGRSVLVASEPDDDDPGWREVADRTLLVATPATVQQTPLARVPERERTPRP